MSERVCETCKATFYAKPAKILKGGGRYCSRHCYQVAPKAPRTGKRVALVCEVCNVTLIVKKSRAAQGKFCSRKCLYTAQTIPLEVRFQKYISQSTPTENGCLLWAGPLDVHGYGILMNHPGAPRRATRIHRLVWEQANGPIPDDMEICHVCDVPGCVALPHLFLGTHADNMRDMSEKGRAAVGERSNLASTTEDVVRTIRARRAQGDSLKQLAEDYEMSQGNVSMIVNGHSWQHVI